MKVHNGTILIPLKNQLKIGHMRKMNDHFLAVLVVLLHHENRKTRLAFPSQDLIAIEAGIGKQNISASVNELEEAGLLTWGPGPSGRHGIITEYKFEYTPYAEYPAPHMWFGMQSAVVSNGIWSAMPHSVKRLYLLLLAISWDASWADIPVDACQRDYSERENWGSEGGRFVDATKLSPKSLASLSGLHERTLRRAREWLFINGLVCLNDDMNRTSSTDLYREGIMIVDVREIHSSTFEERRATHKAKASAPSREVRISLSRLKKSPQKKAVLSHLATAEEGDIRNLGHDNRGDRTPEARRPDTTIP